MQQPFDETQGKEIESLHLEKGQAGHKQIFIFLHEDEGLGLSQECHVGHIGTSNVTSLGLLCGTYTELLLSKVGACKIVLSRHVRQCHFPQHPCTKASVEFGGCLGLGTLCLV